MEKMQGIKKQNAALSPDKRRDLEHLMQLPKRKRDMLIAVAAGMMLADNTNRKGV